MPRPQVSYVIALLIAVSSAALFLPALAEAKTATFNNTFSSYPYIDGVLPSDFENPDVSVTYGVSVLTTSGTPIPENSTVAQGSQIVLKFTPLSTNPPTWNASYAPGLPTSAIGSMDGSVSTNYNMLQTGTWGAPAPALCSAPTHVARFTFIPLCLDTLSGNVNCPNPAPVYNFDIYASFAVNPAPTLSLGNLNGLSCGAISGGEATCTVTGTGALDPTFNFSSSNAYFGAAVSQTDPAESNYNSCGSYGGQYDNSYLTGGITWYGSNIGQLGFGADGDIEPETKIGTALPIKAESISYALVSQGEATAADLTAGAVAPSTATENSPVAFSSVITNLGSAATSGPFPVLYQLGTGENDDGTLSGNISNIGVDSSAPTLAANNATENSTMDSGYTFTSSGTYYVRACANTTDNQSFDVAESNTGNNCGPATEVDVSSGNTTSGPDLTATDPIAYASPVSINESVDYSQIVRNIGDAPTGTSFPVLFQWASDSAGDGAVDLGHISSVPALAGGNAYESTGPFTYATSTPGTFFVRACANTTNNSTFGPVNEGTNTGNNCGPWTEVDVSGQTINTSLSCSAYPGTIVQGSDPQIVTYTATPGGGVMGPYTWTASDETFNFGTKATAKRNFSNAAPDMVYDMSVSGTNEDGSPTASVSCQPNVHVETAQEACGTVGGTISASPLRILSGGTTAITWNATSAQDSCTVIDQSGNVLDSVTAESCEDPLGDTKQTGPLTTQTIYTLTCDGVVLDSVTVNVVPTFKEF